MGLGSVMRTGSRCDEHTHVTKTQRRETLQATVTFRHTAALGLFFHFFEFHFFQVCSIVGFCYD